MLGPLIFPVKYFGVYSHHSRYWPGLRNLLHLCIWDARKCRENEGKKWKWERMRKWSGNGERMRKWRGNGERMRKWGGKWREIDSLHFLILSPFPPYALWGNISGSNLLRGSSASCAGLVPTVFWHIYSLHFRDWVKNLLHTLSCVKLKVEYPTVISIQVKDFTKLENLSYINQKFFLCVKFCNKS